MTIPENCAFARFRSPRLFIEAMQFTDNGLYTLVEKRYTHVYTYLAPGRRSVNWIFRPARASFDVTFHNACRISAGYSVSTVAVPQIEKGNRGKDEDFLSILFNERCWILRIYLWIYENLSLVRNFSYTIRKLLITDYSRTVAFSRWTSAIRCK